jgi:hypothetical protein
MHPMNLDQRPQVVDTKNVLTTFPIAIEVGPNLKDPWVIDKLLPVRTNLI